MALRQEMDRRINAYQGATVLDEAMLLETWYGGENQIEPVALVTKTDGLVTPVTLRIGESPKFVDNDYFEGRGEFQNVKRTIGELLAPSIQFSEAELKVSNVDGFYSRYLVGGADYFSFTGSTVTFKFGIRDVGATFLTVFNGIVKADGGFTRSVTDFTIVARDVFEDLNRDNPLPVIDETDYPGAFASNFGKTVPFVLGDWEAGFNFAPAQPYKYNAGGIDYDIDAFAPTNLYGGILGYYVGGDAMSGSFFLFAVGTYQPDDISNCYIKRGDNVLRVDFNTSPVVKAGRYTVQILGLVQAVTNATVPYVPQDGDVALVSVKVPYAPGKYSNAVEIAREVIEELAFFSPAGFDNPSWTTIAAKATPAQDAIATIKARLWVGKTSADTTPLALALGLLEQVRVEMFVDRFQKLRIATLHIADFPSVPARRVDQFQVAEKTFSVKGDERNFFNSALANYGYTPITDKTALRSTQFANQNCVTRIGRLIGKEIDLPFLYDDLDVERQVKEFVRFYSMGIEYIECELAWVHLLSDVGEFLRFNFEQGGVAFSEVPCQIRDKTIDFKTGASKVRMIGFHVFPFGSYTPPNASRLLSSQSQAIVPVTL